MERFLKNADGRKEIVSLFGRSAFQLKAGFTQIIGEEACAHPRGAQAIAMELAASTQEQGSPMALRGLVLLWHLQGARGLLRTLEVPTGGRGLLCQQQVGAGGGSCLPVAPPLQLPPRHLYTPATIATPLHRLNHIV